MEQDSSPSDTWKGREITYQTTQPHGSKMDRWGRGKGRAMGRKEEYWEINILVKWTPMITTFSHVSEPNLKAQE